eukprot:1158843-Pelagomonas_calceolata.AAC.3
MPEGMVMLSHCAQPGVVMPYRMVMLSHYAQLGWSSTQGPELPHAHRTRKSRCLAHKALVKHERGGALVNKRTTKTPSAL